MIIAERAKPGKPQRSEKQKLGKQKAEMGLQNCGLLTTDHETTSQKIRNWESRKLKSAR
jgi:hypothetical protein